MLNSILLYSKFITKPLPVQVRAVKKSIDIIRWWLLKTNNYCSTLFRWMCGMSELWVSDNSHYEFLAFQRARAAGVSHSSFQLRVFRLGIKELLWFIIERAKFFTSKCSPTCQNNMRLHSLCGLISHSHSNRSRVSCAPFHTSFSTINKKPERSKVINFQAFRWIIG